MDCRLGKQSKGSRLACVRECSCDRCLEAHLNGCFGHPGECKRERVCKEKMTVGTYDWFVNIDAHL
jgi:hypothetical protein